MLVIRVAAPTPWPKDLAARVSAAGLPSTMGVPGVNDSSGLFVIGKLPFHRVTSQFRASPAGQLKQILREQFEL